MCWKNLASHKKRKTFKFLFGKEMPTLRNSSQQSKQYGPNRLRYSKNIWILRTEDCNAILIPRHGTNWLDRPIILRCVSPDSYCSKSKIQLSNWTLCRRHGARNRNLPLRNKIRPIEWKNDIFPARDSKSIEYESSVFLPWNYEKRDYRYILRDRYPFRRRLR